MYMHILPACLCTASLSGAYGDQNRVLDPLDVMNGCESHVGVRNRTSALNQGAISPASTLAFLLVFFVFLPASSFIVIFKYWGVNTRHCTSWASAEPGSTIPSSGVFLIYSICQGTSCLVALWERYMGSIHFDKLPVWELLFLVASP